MICEACRDRRHDECRGENWCDCQHLPPEADAPEASRDAEEECGPGKGRSAGDDDRGGEHAEPGVNWLRQG